MSDIRCTRNDNELDAYKSHRSCTSYYSIDQFIFVHTSFYLNMGGIYFFLLITVTATVVFAWPGDTEIRPIPQECPLEDSQDYTVHIAHKDCTKFCKCANGVAYLMDCPAKLHFNKLLQVCDYSARAKCDGKGTTSGQCEGSATIGTTKPTPTPTATPEPGCTEGETYPHECACEKYYKCKKGNLVLQKCNEGEHYSKSKKRCTRSSKAGCIKPKKFF